MARAKEPGNGKLEEALQALLRAQATLVQSQAETQAAYYAQKAEADKRIAEFEKETKDFQRQALDRFTQIDKRFEQIEAILLEHNRILRALPDAIGEKIGFKTPPTKTPAD